MDKLKQLLNQALKYLGEHEILGRVDNQWILDCFKFTSYQAGHDEVPWCAAYIGRLLAEIGLSGTHSAAAASYVNWGKPSKLIPGAIVVFKWASGEHHVSVCHHDIDNQYAAFVGGNQSNMVKISVYSKRFIIAIRQPA